MRIPKVLKKRLLILLYDSLISVGVLILTSKMRSKRKWKSIKGGRGCTVKHVKE